MSHIKISVKDFTAIHSADIDIKGITVIAAVNDSGNTTQDEFLYNFFFCCKFTNNNVNKRSFSFLLEKKNLIDVFW